MEEREFNLLADRMLASIELVAMALPVALGRWIGTRDGEELMMAIARCMAEQSGRPVSLA